jgi:GT2 family glycosyltransferase
MTSIAGFSESLGMDAIDAEACLRLRENGYQVTALHALEIVHAIGDTRVHRILGRDVHVTHHSRERLNAMVANRLRLFPRELRQSSPHALRTVRRVVTNYLLSRTK